MQYEQLCSLGARPELRVALGVSHILTHRHHPAACQVLLIPIVQTGKTEAQGWEVAQPRKKTPRSLSPEVTPNGTYLAQNCPPLLSLSLSHGEGREAGTVFDPIPQTRKLRPAEHLLAFPLLCRASQNRNG